MTELIITIEMSDPSDLDWLRNRCLPPVEDAVAEALDEERLDGTASVSWDVKDD